MKLEFCLNVLVSNFQWLNLFLEVISKITGRIRQNDLKRLRQLAIFVEIICSPHENST